MKLLTDISAARRGSGMLLVECLVYIAVFTILLGIGTAAFYFCWDHTRAVVSTANDVESALRVGEGWRADVRAATGAITVESTAAGETVRIPAGTRDIVYRFAAGELRREVSPQNDSRLLLKKVKVSEMKAELRVGVTAWRWELELTSQQRETRFPLLFTFEAVPSKS